MDDNGDNYGKSYQTLKHSKQKFFLKFFFGLSQLKRKCTRSAIKSVIYTQHNSA